MPLLRGVFRRTGFDLVPAYFNSKATLIGISRLSVRTVIDVGANDGQFVRRALRLFPRARYICFEPVPDAFHRLETWKRGVEDRFTIECVNIALGEEDGIYEMKLHVDHDTSSSLLLATSTAKELFPWTTNQRGIAVRVARMDEIINAGDLRDEILVKLDVQGFEDRVIRGGKAVFRKARACITEVSVDDLYEGQATFDSIYRELAPLGYRFVGCLEQVFARDGRVIFFDAVFSRSS